MKDISTKTKVLSALGLLFATILWGINYVAQQKGSQHMGAFTFNMMRMIIGASVVLPVVLVRNFTQTKKLSFWRDGDNVKETVKGGLIAGAALVAGLTCQQIGIKMTTVGKAGFLSSLSVIVVPLIGMLRGKKVELYQWIGIFTAVIGVGLLSLNNVTGINLGDMILLMTSFFIALHILSAGYFNKRVDSFQFSVMRFLFAGVICAILMLLIDEIDIDEIKKAIPAILFSGVFGSGFAFTLMAVSQKYLDNIATSIIMSLESVFAALSGLILLNQRMTGREILGCIVVFSAVLGLQVYGEIKRKKTNVES